MYILLSFQFFKTNKKLKLKVLVIPIINISIIISFKESSLTYSKTSMPYKCIVCDEKYIPIKGHQNKCHPCKYKQKISCNGCTKIFIIGGGFSGSITLCQECDATRKTLMSKNIDPDLIREGFIMQVTYDVYIGHYCPTNYNDNAGSGCDESNSIRVDMKTIINYPLLKIFKNNHINDEGVVIDGPIKMYCKDYNDNTEKGECHNGDVEIGFDLTEAKIIEIGRKPDLGE